MNQGFLRLSAIIAVIALIMCSCQTKEQLSQQMEGTWTASPERIADSSDMTVGIIKSYTFEPETPDGGMVDVSAMLDIVKEIPAGDSIKVPVTVSVAATASITGSYTATAYNKAEMKFDRSTFQLNIDPLAMRYAYDAVEGVEEPDWTALSPMIAADLRDELAAKVRASLSENTLIDNVKIKKSIMNCHLGESDITLRRQDAE